MIGGHRLLVGTLVLALVLGPQGAWVCAAAAGPGFGVPNADELVHARQSPLAALRAVLPAPAELRTLADAALKRANPEDFEPALKARTLGGGVDAVFAYVRDAIRYEPYPGVLRGPTGALASRAANAADRSLLLADMLKAGGVTSRFAVGKLDAENAAALLDRTFAAPTSPSATALASMPSPTGSNPATDLLARVRARAARDYATVIGAVGEALPAATSVVPRDALLGEIANDHVWVQARQGDAWIDLDSSFADAKPGKTYTNAMRTLDALLPEMHQRVTLRVVTETLTADGKLAEETNVEVTEPAATLVMKPVFLLHCAKSGFSSLGDAIKGETKDKYAPAFWVNGTITAGKHLSFADPQPAGTAKDDKQAGGGLGGLGGALGALDDRPAAATAPAAGPRLVAEYLDVVITLPGGRTVSTPRRTLLDRGGAAWRAAATHDPAALRPFDRDDNGPTAANAIHNVIVTTGRHDLANYARDVVGSFKLDAKDADADTWSGLPDPPKDMDPERGLALALLPLATMNFGATLFADETFLPAINDGDGSTRLYRDSPRVTLVSSSVVQKDGRAAVYTTLDWRRDVLRGAAREPSGARAVAEQKLWYGLLEGALEHEWVAQQLVGEVTRLESTTAANDDASRAAAVLGATFKRPDAIGLKPDPAAEAVAAVADGEVLVVPAGAVGADSRGWWAIASGGDTRAVWSVGHVVNGGHLPPNIPKNSGGTGVNSVDPATGRGVSRRGGGGEMGEYATTIEINLPFGYVWVGTGKQLAAIVIAGATVLAAIGGGAYAGTSP